ncbi:hypothetical protein KXD97_28255 [Mycobacterium sp. SMC-8]|uniref:hypothetical protein n=1 Tax=Mycobacterium sp. SMC-8 TaxID=2857060 RepID=UPI0021B27524|nr:hypothetical protein [Mycobacterium sp. SMC-8]UXA11809.1 hypothetical protein KXD97_28255 [Mycobacterium sp. SMC-8]
MRTPYSLAPPAELALSAAPTLKGKQAAHRWIAEELGVAMTLNYFVTQANQHRVPHHWIGRAMYFSTLDLWHWVMSHHRPAKDTV